VRDWPAPDFGIDQHKSYMVQWYSLAALGVVLWLALNWRTDKGDGAAPR
jgi:cytochrome oxidase assembly protein ShyY1